MKSIIKNKNTNKLLIMLITLLYCIIILIACDKQGKIDIVYSNDEEFTEFDEWLTDDVGVYATPAHIIIKDGYITNVVNETISYKSLTEERKRQTTKIDVSEKLLNQYVLSSYDIIIVKTENCEACEYQDENYAEEIFEKYKSLNFLIYYIQTEDPCLNGCD